jgi:hypothetical protein
MNEDIIKWAREAGFSDHSNPEMWGYMIASAEELARFAALVAAAEREACAKVCDVRCVEDGWEGGYADECAAEIRARSEA